MMHQSLYIETDILKQWQRILILVFILLRCECIFSAVLWSACRNVPIGYVELNNVCVALKEIGNCEVEIDLSIAGKELINRALNLSFVPQLCTKYHINSLNLDCDLCVTLQTEQHQTCILLNTMCSGMNFGDTVIGCFNNSILDPVVECKSG
jgi:hypothetical protein